MILSKDRLEFAALREINVKRCEAVFHRLFDWSPTDWACAMGGECGEALNVVKKMHRGDMVPAHSLANELADLIIYADLLAARHEIDLGAAVRRKFNEVSERRGSDIRLPEAG